MIVDDSWFSPNYHQLPPTIIHIVKRPKKFVIIDDSSPAVALAKSREQRVPSSLRVKIWTLNGVPARSVGQTCKSMKFFATKEGGSLFSVNRFVGGMYGRWVWRELVEEKTEKGVDQKEKRKPNVKIGGRIETGGHCRLQWNVPRDTVKHLRKYNELLTAIGPVITNTADRKTIMNYHTRGQTRREKLSSTIMKNLNKLKMNDSIRWW